MSSTTSRKRPKGSKEPKEESGGGGLSTQQQPETQGDGKKRKKKQVSWKPVIKTIGYFGLAILIPSLLNYAVLNQESRMLIPTGGVMYDIGWSQKLFLKCSGSGLPTVVLDAPLGQSSEVWVLVEPLIAKATRVCVYDRAGLGFSERGYHNTSLYSGDFSEAAVQRDKAPPSTAERMADDLHRLVSASSNQPKPLLLVSSDFITFVSRFYTQIYEHEVSGLFLIDPAFEGLFAVKKNQDSPPKQSSEKIVTWPDLWYKKIVPHYQGKWFTSVIGFNRISLMLGLMSPVEDNKLLGILSKDIITRKKHAMCNPKHLSTAFDEHYYINESMDQVRTMMTVKPFPTHLPVTIATYEKSLEFLGPVLSEDWKMGQDKIVKRLHPNSKRVVLPGKDYVTFYTHPKHVAGPILDMVNSWRKESKLAA